MVGLGIGLIVETWLANVLAQTIPVMVAFWLAAVLTLLGGLIAVILMKRKTVKINFSFSLSQWLILFLLTILFISIGRGLALFDDYQNLPTISLMATGDIPPHFALDPHFSFNLSLFITLIRGSVHAAWKHVPMDHAGCLARIDHCIAIDASVAVGTSHDSQ